jgi:hypothetical protein
VVFVLGFVAIVLIGACSGFLVGQRGTHVLRDAGMISLAPILGYAGFFAWLFAWQAGCPDCASGDDSRRAIFLINAVYLGIALAAVLVALGAATALGSALSQRPPG